MNKTKGIVVASILSLSLLGTIPVFAASEDSTAKEDQSFAHHDQRGFKGVHFGQKYNLTKSMEIIKQRAEKLGIDTAGKDLPTLAQEMKNAILQKKDAEIEKKANELGIDTDGKENGQLIKEIKQLELQKKADALGIDTIGKDLKTLSKEIRQTELIKEATELGISTEGKKPFDLAKEIRENKINDVASKLNIDTENKTVKEIMKEIFKINPAELKGLDFFPIKEHHKQALKEHRQEKAALVKSN